MFFSGRYSVLYRTFKRAIGTALSRDRSEVTLFLIMDIFAVPVQYFLKAFEDMGDLCLHLVGGDIFLIPSLHDTGIFFQPALGQSQLSDSLIHKTGDARQIRSHLLLIVGIQFFQSSVFFFLIPGIPCLSPAWKAVF